MKNLFSVLMIYLMLPLSAHAQEPVLYLKAEGRDSLQTRIIDSLNYRKRFENLNRLYREIDSLGIRLQYAGFIENERLGTSKINDSVYLTEFDLKSKFDTIYIYTPQNSFSESDLSFVSKSITPAGFSVPISEVESTLKYLTSILTGRGLPFASLKLNEFERISSNSIAAKLNIQQGERRSLDKIIIKGYEKFPKSYVRHFLRIRPRDDFDLNTIREKAEAINDIPFTVQTRPAEVLFTQDSTTLYLYIEKQKSNNFDGFLGFGTDEETNKLQFDGYLNLNLVNSLNYGETLQLNYKSDENDQQTFNLRTRLPYIFRSPIGIDLNLNIFKKDSSFTNVQQKADAFYQINSRQSVSIGVNSFQSNDLLSGSQADVTDLSATFFSLKYNYQNPFSGNLLFPFRFALRTEVSLGTRESDQSLSRQQTYLVDIQKILDLNEKNSIFVRLNSSGIFSDDYFDNELLRFGGINSIRGFEENILIASLQTVLNTEYRYLLNRSIYIHSIIDLAYFENDLQNSSEKLFGIGFGFGLLTRAGLLKFNYANGKFEDQSFQFSNSKIHLSLVARF